MLDRGKAWRSIAGPATNCSEAQVVIQEWLNKCPLIAILRGIQTDEVNAMFSALSFLGIVIAEIPLNSPEPLRSIQQASSVFGDRMLVGAGTVTRVSDVAAAQEAGAKLIVSPNADPRVVREAKRRDLIALPGVATATEAFSMIRAGADALKIFPADVVGTHFVKALRAVVPTETLLIPVGGVDDRTIPNWIRAGVNGLGVGSALYRPGASIHDTSVRARSLLESTQILNG